MRNRYSLVTIVLCAILAILGEAIASASGSSGDITIQGGCITFVPGVVGSGHVNVNAAYPCGAPDQYEEGTSVSLTAVPDSGWVFSGWTGNNGCSGTSNPITVFVDPGSSCTVTFIVEPITTPRPTRTPGVHLTPTPTPHATPTATPGATPSPSPTPVPTGPTPPGVTPRPTRTPVHTFN